MRDYIRLCDEQIQQVLPLIIHEFTASPILTYLIPDEDERKSFIPALFKTILTTYEEIGDTYVTPSYDFTFSLVDGKLNHGLMPFITEFLQTIPSTLNHVLSLSIVDISKRLLHLKEPIIDLVSYLSEQDQSFFFLSSIGILNQDIRQERMDDMLTWLIQYSKEKQLACIVETETLENVSLYQSFGFQLEKQYLISKPKTCLYLLRYCPK